MTVVSIEECSCSCHDFPEGVVHHCMPCCAKCIYCGRNISYYCFDAHEEECRKKFWNIFEDETISS